jgi:hypothetical protein
VKFLSKVVNAKDRAIVGKTNALALRAILHVYQKHAKTASNVMKLKEELIGVKTTKNLFIGVN